MRCDEQEANSVDQHRALVAANRSHECADESIVCTTNNKQQTNKQQARTTHDVMLATRHLQVDNPSGV